jgi:hypothetical protein
MVKLLSFWEAASAPYPEDNLSALPASAGAKAVLLQYKDPFETKDGWAFLGDWLSPHGSERSDSPEALLFNNMYVLYCNRIAAAAARVLGKDDDVRHYDDMSSAMAAGIRLRFYNRR